MPKTKEEKQSWWKSLTAEEQSAQIGKWERSRKKNRKDRTGEIEVFKTGAIKVWHHADSYSVYKNAFMLKQYNEAAHNKLTKELINVRKEEDR